MCPDWELNQDLSLHRTMPKQLSHTGQGQTLILQKQIIKTQCQVTWLKPQANSWQNLGQNTDLDFSVVLFSSLFWASETRTKGEKVMNGIYRVKSS